MRRDIAIGFKLLPMTLTTRKTKLFYYLKGIYIKEEAIV
jgi:hypothetical protein